MLHFQSVSVQTSLTSGAQNNMGSGSLRKRHSSEQYHLQNPSGQQAFILKLQYKGEFLVMLRHHFYLPMAPFTLFPEHLNPTAHLWLFVPDHLIFF